MAVELLENASIFNSNLNIYVSWSNLNFIVPDTHSKEKNAKKTILNDLNGHVSPGELVAVIGPSGSGKSSFLNCISGRNTDGITGNILFNGVKRPSNFSRFTGYVIQDDLYFESLTVFETLLFSANLKLPKMMSNEYKLKKINSIVNELDLNKCLNTKIGTVGDGISGGERRRLAIALEIINEPSLLLLDEPTSGLDSASALLVGKILKNLATKRKITILATIHQPRYSLATLFDKIYFLGKGHELYYGPSFPNCLKYFEQCGYPCPEYDNPADFLLDLVNTTNNTNNDKSDNNDEEKQDSKTRDEIIDELAEKYKQSEYAKNALNMDIPESLHGNIIFQEMSSKFYITPVSNQIWTIFKRTFLHKLREPIATMTQAFNSIFMPIVFGSVYWKIDNSQQSAYDRISAIALVVLMQAFAAFDILMLFPLERNIFNREQSSGMYRPISFYIGRTLAEFPQHSIFALIMSSISYWMYGLQNDATKFGKFCLVVILATNCGAGLLMLFGALAKNLEQSNLLATLFLLVFMLFDGNWISLDKVPAFWSWIRYISFLGYASQAAIVNEYRGLTFKCTPEEVQLQECLFTNGEDILYTRGLNDIDYWDHVYVLIALLIAFRVLAFIAFSLFHRNKRPMTIIKESCCCC